MITEDYVSFETAKLLKEKGFDGECKRMFRASKSFEPKVYDYPEWITNEDLCDLYQNCEFATIPTLQMAIKWLRKKHNLAISVSVTVDGWHSSVSQIKLDSEGFVVDIIDGIDNGNIPNHDTYEEACEAAIKYCLENLI